MGPEETWFDSRSPDSYKLDKRKCTVAPTTLTPCKWYLNMGGDVIKGKHWENSLDVTLDYGRQAVTAVYYKGVHGFEEREHMPVPEALEWLDKIQREWSEYGSQIGTMIDGIRRHQQ